MTKNKPRIFSDLERLADFIPAPLYWGDTNAIVLGVNDSGLRALGVKREDIVGKNVYAVHPKDAADLIMEHDKQVIRERKAITFEDSVVDEKTGKTGYFLSTIAPLFDDKGIEVVGLIETSTDITERKENERLRIETELQRTKLQEQLKLRKIIDQAAHDIQSPLAILLVVSQQCMGLLKDKIFDVLKTFVSFIPVGTFWLDTDSRIIGANKNAVMSWGGTSADNFIGKTAYDLYPLDMADKIMKHNKEVIQTGRALSQEETIKDLNTGEIRYFTAFKAPLFDDKGDIVGLVGTVVDITAEKNAERFKIETELQKAKIQEQEKFGIIASQVAHDIRSPLASLSMIAEMCKEISEPKRITLREVATSISDIANNLLNRYKKNEEVAESKASQPILLSLILSEILSSKKYQYNNSPINFYFSAAPDSYFTFIYGNQSNFRRMISNLMNNAVEAFDGREGTVDLNIILDGEYVKVIIRDNGKGIPKEVLDKINNSIAITSGKKDGSGIGLNQVRDTLQACNGKMSIESKIGKGTKITLTFPIGKTADWIAEKIELNKGDIVVILDDDSSIHGAWKSRFEPYELELNIHNFTLGEEAMDFVNSLTPEERDTVFLLSDYELINQELNGLQIIDQLSMHNRSILVTSHYNNQKVCDLATQAGIKILPKQLASEIPIRVEEKEIKSVASNLKKVELVIIDDDQLLADSLATFLKDRFTGVEAHYHPNHFLKNLSNYAKDTIICMDHDFKAQIDGIELAKQLNEAGYTKLYLISGKTFEDGEIPEYLTVLLKGDMAALDKLI